MVNMSKVIELYYLKKRAQDIKTKQTLIIRSTWNYRFASILYFSWTKEEMRKNKLFSRMFIFFVFLKKYIKKKCAKSAFFFSGIDYTLATKSYLYHHSPLTISKGPMARKKWSREQYCSKTMYTYFKYSIFYSLKSQKYFIYTFKKNLRQSRLPNTVLREIKQRLSSKKFKTYTPVCTPRPGHFFRYYDYFKKYNYFFDYPGVTTHAAKYKLLMPLGFFFFVR